MSFLSGKCLKLLHFASVTSFAPWLSILPALLASQASCGLAQEWMEGFVDLFKNGKHVLSHFALVRLQVEFDSSVQREWFVLGVYISSILSTLMLEQKEGILFWFLYVQLTVCPLQSSLDPTDSPKSTLFNLLAEREVEVSALQDKMVYTLCAKFPHGQVKYCVLD